MNRSRKREDVFSDDRRCPHCGSCDVAVILRGLPVYSPELKKAMEDHKVILGGCCITGDDPSAHCNVCGKDFGKPPYIKKRKRPEENEPRELFPEAVTDIAFSKGGFFEGKDQVQIVTENGKHIVHYKHFPDEAEEPYSMEVTEARWKRIMNTLFYRLCVHEWKKKYVDPGVLDGTQWELELKLTRGRHYTIYGSNAFPALYKELVRVFKPFMKCLKG